MSTDEEIFKASRIVAMGRFFVEIVTREPGKVTGKVYSVLSGVRLIRGIMLLMWYRITGKIKTSM
jgi:hypothetical protein